MANKKKLRSGDKVEVIYSPIFSKVKINTIGTIYCFNTHDDISVIFDDGTRSVFHRNHLHRVGDPEKYQFLDINITQIDNKQYKGILSFIHRFERKHIHRTGSCPYNVCKDLVSYFKNDPLKHVE